ncbi:hypothetical protein VTN00DRAFT_9091 [Thermoascus crustaceus]|uniref:uncharacterized protein n=1 Tax=Thermoascus crustaceus TaxID=5088 RepID=UPI00374347E5
MDPFNRPGEISMTQDELSRYVPTHEYSSTAPAQPSMVIPPPSLPLYADDTSRFDTVAPSSHDFEYGEFASPEFFKSVSADRFNHKAQLTEWTYEMRREAQDFLVREGITLLLAIRSRRSAQARLVSGEKVAAQLGIEADAIDISDNQELIAEFPRAIRRINDHLSSPSSPALKSTSPAQRKILVFCESGNERSASVVIAYLMVMLNLNMVDALYIVQHRRFCVCIEEPMRHLLASFESILAAKRDVTKAKRDTLHPNWDAAQVQTPRKRSFSDLNDSAATAEHDTEMDMDGDRYVERNPSAPFQDR